MALPPLNAEDLNFGSVESVGVVAAGNPDALGKLNFQGSAGSLAGQIAGAVPSGDISNLNISKLSPNGPTVGGGSIQMG